jgi:glutathione S-transferase
MSLKLHVFPLSPRAFKVLSVAAYLRLEHEVCFVDMTKGEHKSEAFTALNPNQRMPVMEENGFVLWESNAILQHLASKRLESGLLPADPAKRALVAQWQFWDMAHWDPACATLILENVVKRLFRNAAPDPAKVAEGLALFERAAKVLDAHLASRRFIVGDSVTLADFSVGSALNLSQSGQLPVDSYPHITSWYARLTELPGWRKSMVVPPANVLPQAQAVA